MEEKLPASIARAICRVQGAIESVKKDSRNQHGGYNYASTDAIYAALALKMAEAGLVIITMEDRDPVMERREKDGKTALWGVFVFRFVLATDEDSWTHPRLQRTVISQITGPQSFQAAQSFCEKALLRSLFKLPTGDLDLDAMPQAETMETAEALAGNGTKRKSSATAKRDGSDKTFNEIRTKIAGAQTADHVRQIELLYAEEIASLPSRWHEIIKDELVDRHDALQGVAP